MLNLYKAKYYYKRIISKVSLYGYINSSLKYKIFILFVLSSIIIVFFGLFIGLDESYRSFSEPASIPETLPSISYTALSIFTAIIGLLFSSMIIALVSQAYMESIIKMKDGNYPFKGLNHHIIINLSDKIWSILDAYEKRYARYDEIHDVVLVLSNNIETNYVLNKIETKKYKHLRIFIKKGDLLNKELYKNIKINYANSICLLVDDSNTNIIKSNNNSIMIFDFIQSEFNFEKTKFLVEIKRNNNEFDILKTLSMKKNININIIKSDKFSENIMGMSLVDINYLNSFNELISYNKYGIYILDTQLISDKITDLRFIDAYFCIENATLIGISNEKISLNPDINYRIKKNDKLILISKNIKSIKFTNSFNKNEFCEIITNNNPFKSHYSLKEKHNKRVLLIGNNSIKRYLKKNLDSESYENIVTINEDNIKDTIQKIDDVIKKYQFDTILINMNEDLNINIYYHLKYINDNNNYKILDKTLIIINDINNYISLRNALHYKNIINESNIVGYHIGQTTFMPELNEIFNELSSHYGNEMYFINIEKINNIHFNYEVFESILINSSILVIGYITKDKIIEFKRPSNKDITQIDSLIVLSEGETKNA